MSLTSDKKRVALHEYQLHFLYLRIFRKSVEKIKLSLKSDKKKRVVLHEYQHTFFLSYLAQLLFERNLVQFD